MTTLYYQLKLNGHDLGIMSMTGFHQDILSSKFDVFEEWKKFCEEAKEYRNDDDFGLYFVEDLQDREEFSELSFDIVSINETVEHIEA
jgi:hypothetical protein